jgi:hypothetical protein
MSRLKKLLPLLPLCVCLAGAAVLSSTSVAQQNAAALPKVTPPPDSLPAHGRVVLQAPKHPLRLGEENQLDLVLRGPKPTLIEVCQSQMDPSAGVNVIIDHSDQIVPLEHRADGSSYVNVIPVRLGKVEFQANVEFADGGIEPEEVAAQVIAPHAPVKLKVSVGSWNMQTPAYMDLSTEWRKQYLSTQAIYAGVGQLLNIPAKDVQFHVTMDRGLPAIRFDPATGEIDALQLGHALIEASYGGLAQTTCVLVTEKVDPFDSSRCEELRPGGSRILPTQEGADAPGAEMGSKLPYTADDNRQGRFEADDRAEVQIPREGLYLATPTDIELTVQGPAVARVECSVHRQSCGPWTGKYSGLTLPLVRHADGRTTVSVFPADLTYPGKPDEVEYTFSIFFVDGGVAIRQIKTTVGIGLTPPLSIGEDCLHNPLVLRPIDLGAPKNGVEQLFGDEQLRLPACYQGLRTPVWVNPQFVEYSVKTDGEAPVVLVNNLTGKVTAVAPGQALVIESFGTKQTAQCVVVAGPDRSFEHNFSNCRALRAQYGFPLPPMHARPVPTVVGPNAPEALKDYEDQQAMEDAVISPDIRDPFPANDRLQIQTEGITAVLGEPVKVTVRLTGPARLLEGVEYYKETQQTSLHGVGLREMNDAAAPEQAADGSSRLKLVAMQTGVAEFRLVFLFADDGVATRVIDLPVRLPDHPPVKLINALGFDSPGMPVIPATTLHLLTETPNDVRQLYPVVWFDTDGTPVPVDPRDVTFSVKTAGSEPVIRLDPASGEITALRPGHALVRTRFDDAESETCVVVMRNVTDGDPSNCEELRGHR